MGAAQPGGDVIGAHRIDRDATGTVIDRCGSGEPDDTVFGRTVGRHMGKPRLGRLTGDVDDASPPALLLHDPRCRLAAVEDTAEGDIQY